MENTALCLGKLTVCGISKIDNSSVELPPARAPDPCGEGQEERTHLGILPPSGSWWWYCSTITVTTTERPTMIMVLAKYWAAETRDAG